MQLGSKDFVQMVLLTMIDRCTEWIDWLFILTIISYRIQK